TPLPIWSPSAASFDIAPRNLNEPVPWRFSAFNTTVVPARSDSLRVVTTGGSRTTPAPATAARSMLAVVTRLRVSPSVAKRHHSVDFNPCALRQRRDLQRHAGGRVGLEEGRIDLVDLVEVSDVGEVDGQLDRVAQRCG